MHTGNGNHYFRISIIVLAYEFLKLFGKELFNLVRDLPQLQWINSTQLIILLFSNTIIFLLYAITIFWTFDNYFTSNRKKVPLISAGFIILIILFRYCLEEVIFLQLFGFGNYYPDVSIVYYFIDNLYYAILYSSFGLLYFYHINSRRDTIEKQRLIIANKQSQLLFLRSQINPHFLFNSLNNIYSLVYQRSNKSLSVIQMFSDLLRDMLYVENETVTISQEMKYVQKYIDLQILRFPQAIRVEQRVVGDLGFMIAPLLLLPFIENAFKHGDFTHEGIHISIALEVTDKKVMFQLSNKSRQGNKDKTYGIGLSNIRERLILIYPHKHSLEVIDNESDFQVILHLTK